VKLYLDETRPAPDGWTIATTTSVAVMHLGGGDVEELSLASDAVVCPICEGRGEGDTMSADARAVVNEMIRTGVWPRVKPVVHGPEGEEALLLRDLIDAYWRPRADLEHAPRFPCWAAYGDDAAEVMGWRSPREAAVAFARGRWRLQGKPEAQSITVLDEGRERRFVVHAETPSMFVPSEVEA
jgi:hypothetical protein